jgi:uncharacterized membrane protein
VAVGIWLEGNENVMEEMFKEIAGHIALGVEVTAALIIGIGAVEALVRLVKPTTESGRRAPFAKHREIFVRFGVWLMLGLEFELAADVIRSAISPNWRDIGQLAAIAAIRTVLNYFLAKDIMEQVEDSREVTPSSQVVTQE